MIRWRRYLSCPCLEVALVGRILRLWWVPMWGLSAWWMVGIGHLACGPFRVMLYARRCWWDRRPE